ncbi:MAG: hypothetical protein QM570_13600 [Planctomycetota bacterium]|jgi:hypothetical protein|nr:hypothetical protein [Planctomycetota bacterium]
MAALVLVAVPVRAEPHTYTFYSITNNNPTDVAIGEAQLSVEVSDPGSEQVLFTFHNAGPEASSIARIYFDDFALGLFEGIGGIEDGPGVRFGPGSSPPNLPGGNDMSPSFQTTAGLRAAAVAPAPHNGVNPDEWVGILLDLREDFGFDDVIAGIHTAKLRIGLHVIGFSGGGSESFVIVPAPAAGLLALLGLGTAGVTLRRRGVSGRRAA